MITLVLIFFLQTWLVYSDPTGRATPPLSPEAALGQRVWHDHNCQSCHQIYGFGGFLGPDLTNAHERLSEARLNSILTVGAGQMPAFELDVEERQGIAAFLAEVHRTGRGQLPPQRSFDPAAALARAVANDADLDPDAARGQMVMLEQKCLSCHLPNPVSEKKATDLTTLIAKLGPAGVEGMLAAGIPAKGMPSFALDPADRRALIAFLKWLGANQQAVQRTFEEAAPKKGAATGLPWFEYE
jgi:nitric oxide reductase subunit C